MGTGKSLLIKPTTTHLTYEDWNRLALYSKIYAQTPSELIRELVTGFLNREDLLRQQNKDS